ncbi:MAG: hypothetical protein KGI70_01135 [Patescibacteria group bacterium]|nr:hypothetical protein [Patescibacteria group bacterium]
MALTYYRVLDRPWRKRFLTYRYAYQWMRNPDPGSPFEKMSKKFARLPDWLMFICLALSGRDGLVFVNQDGTPVGHVFYHKRKDGWHLFSIYSGRRGLGRHMLRSFLLYAESQHAYNVRLGSDNNDAMRKLRRDALMRMCNLPFDLIAGPSGWITIGDRRNNLIARLFKKAAAQYSARSAKAAP